MYGTLCYNVPYNRKENMLNNKLQEAVIKGMDMHVTTGNNLMKLGKIVETNTDNLNLLATRLLKLEQRIKELEDDKK